MVKIKQHLFNCGLIVLLGFTISCEDLENELAKDFTASTANAMFNFCLLYTSDAADE